MAEPREHIAGWVKKCFPDLAQQMEDGTVGLKEVPVVPVVPVKPAPAPVPVPVPAPVPSPVPSPAPVIVTSESLVVPKINSTFPPIRDTLASPTDSLKKPLGDDDIWPETRFVATDSTVAQTSGVSTMAAKLNFDDLFNPLQDVLKDSLKDLLQGAAEDVREFVVDISKNLARAASLGRQDLVDNLLGQTRMVAELQRIKVVNNAWDTVNKVVSVAGNFALKLVSAAV